MLKVCLKMLAPLPNSPTDVLVFPAANVLIHQEGRLQLCDFGVATVLDTRTDKRRTFIGTLHWMPPELWTENPEYSDEVSFDHEQIFNLCSDNRSGRRLGIWMYTIRVRSWPASK